MFNDRLLSRAFVCASITVVPLLFTGCLQTREDQKELEEKQVVRHQLTNLQQNTADTSQRFSDIEDETRKLNGRVEVVEAKLSQGQSRTDKGVAAFEAKTAQNDQAYREEFSALKAEMAALKTQVSSMQAAADNARQAAAARQEAEAVRSKETAKNPFGTAEEQYEKKQWKDAILSFEKYRSQNPKGKNFPVATYKIGVCFQEMGMNDDAQAFYEEVISKFPKSKEADKASARLKKLKK